MKAPLRMLMLAGSLLVLGSVTASAQAGTVTCKDGSKSKAGQGACSGHGGIAPAGETKKEMKAEKKAEKAEMKTEMKTEMKAKKKTEMKAEKKADKAEKAAAMDASDKNAKGATAECKDHTYSHAKTRQGACSGHGGVSKWLTAK